jgi:hypothetical protein
MLPKVVGAPARTWIGSNRMLDYALVALRH